MSIPKPLKDRLAIPAIAAPMFLVSGPQLVIETCRNGLLGSFPALNARTSDIFTQWLEEITQALASAPEAAPFAVNLIVHKTNTRLQDDIALVVKYRVPLVITSLGLAPELIAAVHSYGGLVFHDVIGARHAAKALEAGVDGIIAVAAGAGGHAGTVNPFAMIAELRPLLGDKTLVLAGSIGNGAAIAAARVAGADMAYLGTRFIATRESLAPDDYKQMLVASRASDVVYTDKLSGVHANFLAPSILRNGLDLATLTKPEKIDVADDVKVWKDLWSAGHGVGGIDDVPTTGELCTRLKQEYRAALAAIAAD